MTAHPIRTEDPARGARLGGWLLSLSLGGYVLVVAASAGAFAASGIGAFPTATRAQVDALGGAWTTLALLVLLAAAVGGLGVVLVARTIAAGSPPAHAVARACVVVAAVSVAVGVVDAVLRIAAGGFGEATLGENGLFRTAEVTGRVAFVLAAVAIALAGFALHRSGCRRIAGLVLGVLGLVLAVLGAVAYDVVPPFALALLWTPLGIVWLTRRRRP
ncbi:MULTISPECIES: hypothetical protein [unclassified Microbacterium]|uniref:hypothetical protein n=1 Tax=unclassified Microbacterium TaxID=2609290 RepID=UPI0030182FD1